MSAPRPTAADYDPRVLALYDDLAHGRVSRRAFAARVAAFVAAGVVTEPLLAALAPNYALAQQVTPDDPRIAAESVTYQSPQGGGEIRGLLARPAGADDAKYPAVLVVHENRGLNPYIEDVARRLAVAGFVALAPDALTPLGGYPGNDDDGRALQRKRDGEEMFQDFAAAAKWLDTHPNSTGKVGVVGFCYGGGVANELAVRLPDVIDAAVPFYGRQPDPEDAAKIEAALLIQNAGLDDRILAGAPAYEAALKAAGVDFTAHVYPGVNHGFHNDTTPRYDEAAAKLAWDRTVAFFKEELAAPPGEPAAWALPADPDPSAILEEAREDALAGRYEVALAKHVWYHDHALEIEPAQYGVRLSFALMYWRSLAEDHPPALDALRAARDRAAAAVEAAPEADERWATFHAFHDLTSINRELGETPKTLALFRRLHATRPAVAAQIGHLARPLLIAAEDFALAAETLDLEGLNDQIQTHDEQVAAIPARLADGDLRENIERMFQEEVAVSVALLARVGRDAEAAAVAAKAKAVRADPAFARAVDAALAGTFPRAARG